MTKRKILLLTFLCLAVWINTIDATIVNVALPAIGDALHATNSDLQWTLDAFNVVVAGCVLLGSGLADRYGRKLILLIGLAVFGLASAAMIFVATPPGLIAARAVMGVGVALIMPSTLSIITVEFEGKHRKRAIGVWAAVSGLGLALGPVLGGYLLDNFSWQSVFLVNVPAALIGFIGVCFVARESRKPGAPVLDYVGGALSLLGLGGVVFGIIEGPVRGWTSPDAIGGLVIGAAALVAFVFWELRTANPMFDIRIFKIGAVAVGAISLMLTYYAMYAILYLVPQLLQYSLGMPIFQVGLAMLPLGALFGILSPLSPRLVKRVGIRSAIAGGLTVMAVGLAILAAVADSADYLLFFVAMVVFASGWSAVMAPVTTVVMDSVPDALAGSAASVNQVSRQVGGAIGVAITGSIVSGIYQSQILALHGYGASTVAAAKRSLSEAITAADSLGGATGIQLADKATQAFASGAQTALAVAAALSLATAIYAYARLRALPQSGA